MKYNFEQKRNDYMTPPKLVTDLLNEIGRKEFDCDVCCSTNNIPATVHFYNGVTDGLKQYNWQKLNWMNPPFDECPKWIKKAYAEQQKGNTTYMLIPVRTETSYWHDCILDNPHCEIRYLRKGLSFIDPETMRPVQMEVKDKKTGLKRFVDGVYKNALAIVIFRGVEAAEKQLNCLCRQPGQTDDEFRKVVIGGTNE